LCVKFVFCRKEILPKTSGNSALTSFFQTSKNLKLEGGFGDLQEALVNKQNLWRLKYESNNFT